MRRICTQSEGAPGAAKRLQGLRFICTCLLYTSTPYTPGEQPRNQAYIKLNTNESPYPPSPGVLAALNRAEGENLRLYSDPEAVELREALAARYGVERENVFVANGSDEALSFAFLAYAADGRGVAFPDISYGFYAVFARLYGCLLYTSRCV